MGHFEVKMPHCLKYAGMTNTPFIKKFKIEDRYYLYDVNSNAIFKADAALYGLIDNDILPPGISKKEIEEARKKINMMKEKGYLLTNRPEITYFHHDNGNMNATFDLLRNTMDTKLSRVTLVLTENCNLRCRYCAYSGKYLYHRTHSTTNMSVNVMENAVDFYFTHSQENPKKAISFYGGEPLANFKLLKHCINYVQKKQAAPASYNMTINGTILTKEMMAFLVENNFALLVSIDGPEEINDRNRVFRNGKGSFRRIYSNLKTFKKSYPEYYQKKVRFNMVVSPPFAYKEISDFIIDPSISPASVRFSGVNDLNTTYYRGISPKTWAEHQSRKREMYASFISRLEKGKELEPIQKYYYSMMFASIHHRSMEKLPSKYPSHGQCMVGARSLLVNVDGSLNFCTQVDDVFNLGNVYHGFDYKKIEKIYLEMDELLKKHCQGCWAIRFCMKCIKSMNEDGKISKNALIRECKGKKEAILSEMIEYIRIREKNPNAFKYLDDVRFY